MTERLEEPEPFVRAVAAETGGTEWGVDGIFTLMDRLQKAGSAHNLFANVQANYGPPAPDPTSPLAPLQKVTDNLTKLMRDGVVGFLDPGSGRFPKGPDGKPLVPEELVEMMRKLTIENRWFGAGDEK